MSREAFIRDLTELLLRLEGGMQEFESPAPLQTEEGLLSAVVAFGDEAVPILLERFTASYERIGHGYIIDALKRIGNPAAVPALIAFHQTYGNYDSHAGAMSALRALGTEQAYLHFGETLTRYALGNPRVVDPTVELVFACQALGEWGDHRAIAPLMAAAQIHHEAAGMPQVALEALAHYPVAHTYLAKVAQQQQAHTTEAPDERPDAQGDEQSDAGESAHGPLMVRQGSRYPATGDSMMRSISERMPMLEYLPGRTLEGGVELANRLEWNLTWGQADTDWYVKSGEKVIFIASTREAVEAFLYGIGIAYGLLSHESFAVLEAEAKKM